MLCKLCQERKPTKKNTHYLTDAIIRPALNQDGSNEREKGFMFDVSSTNPYMPFKFQRSTSQEMIEKALRRQPTEEESTLARKNSFSVDYIFCPDCEKLFTGIENAFMQDILSCLRGQDLEYRREMRFTDNILIRRFAFLQLWRTAVCDPTFNIANSQLEIFRQVILSEHYKDTDITSIPLNIIYLNTLGEPFAYTYNVVGVTTDDSSPVIFMNDVVIQLYENENMLEWNSLYGLNNPKTFYHLINIHETEFLVQIVNNAKRLKFLENYQMERASRIIPFYKHRFAEYYFLYHRKNPSSSLQAQLIDALVYANDCSEEMRYSQERINQYIQQFTEVP